MHKIKGVCVVYWIVKGNQDEWIISNYFYKRELYNSEIVQGSQFYESNFPPEFLPSMSTNQNLFVFIFLIHIINKRICFFEKLFQN